MISLRFEDLEKLVVDATTLPQLMAALADESWRIRRLAADKLARVEATPSLIAALIFMLGQRGDPGARNAAALVLAQLGPAAVDPLVSLLAHVDPDQRKFAADILGELRKPEAVPALVLALKDADANVQGAAAEALGRTGGPEAIRGLESLLDAADPLLRVSALEGMALLRAPPALPRLRLLLENPLTRRSAHRVLGLVQHPTAWALVVASLRARPSRDAALVALSSRSGRLPPDLEADVATALRQMADARAWLAEALTSDDASRRQGALQLAAALGDPALAVQVATAAASSPEAAALALEVLLRLGVPGARALLSGQPPALMHLARDSRAVGGEALLQLSSAVLVEPLVGLLHAGDDELADLAARALGRSGAVTAIAPLIALFADDQLALHARRSLMHLAQSWPDEVRAQLSPMLQANLQPHAVRTWGSVAGVSATDVLRRALHDEKDAVRAAAADSISAVTPDAAALLGAALVDESPRVRLAATRALGTLTHAHSHGPVLSRALADQDPSVLAAACASAGELGATASLPRLIALASHGDVSVVLCALEALSTLGALSDEILGRAMSHPDPEVVKQALTLGADRAVIVAHAHHALRHDRWDVRVAAARALAVGGPRAALHELDQAVDQESDSLARELLAAAAASLASR